MDAGREETYAMDAGERKHHGRRPNTAVGSIMREGATLCLPSQSRSRATSASPIDRSPCSLAIGEGCIEQRHLLPL